MSLNDERGISTMREKIKAFSNIQVRENSEIPSFKVIVFNQAEYISLDAQNALRRIIEVSNNISRFIFITRNTRCIIDPILSRCLQLNLNTRSLEGRIEKHIKYFPSLDRKKIEMICEMYGNFGREIAMMETLVLLSDNEIDKFGIWDRVITDEDIDYLFKMNKSKDTKILDYIMLQMLRVYIWGRG